MPSRIPENRPHQPKFADKEVGDIPREFIERVDMIKPIGRTSIAKANQKNGVKRLHETEKNDPYRDYFKHANAEELPHAGDTHMAALPIFRKQAKAGGYEFHHKKPRKM